MKEKKKLDNINVTILMLCDPYIVFRLAYYVEFIYVEFSNYNNFKN